MLMSMVLPQVVRTALIANGLSKRHASSRVKSQISLKCKPVDFERFNELAERAEVKKAALLFPKIIPSVRPGQKRMAWNTMIKACANAGNLEEAERTFANMQAAHVAPNVQTFGKLIEAAAKSGNDVAADHWLDQLQKRGFELNRIVLSEMIDAAAKAFQAESAEMWLRRMLDLKMDPGRIGYVQFCHRCRGKDRASCFC